LEIFEHYHIQSIFDWFNNNKSFCFRDRETTKCILCKLLEQKYKFYNTLISIKINEISFDRLEDIIYNKFSSISSACKKCSYTAPSNEEIKSENIYKICLTKTLDDIDLPYILYL